MQNNLIILSNKLKEIEDSSKHFKNENEILKEKVNLLEENSKVIKANLEEKSSEIGFYTKEINELKSLLDDEKHKSRNLLNLIKDLEKKKSSEKLEKESKLLKDQVELLTGKLKEIENKFKAKLEDKNTLIVKLDAKLSEYENLLKNQNENME